MHRHFANHPLSRLGRRRSLRAMTIVELLIVITVMTILIGVALPVMKTSFESSRLREATRQVNTHFAVAESIAVENGRGAGVWIDVEALPEDANIRYASRLFLAEIPPPYAGDVVGAAMTVTPAPLIAYEPGNPKYEPDFCHYQAAFDTQSASITSLVLPGDAIRFDFRGPFYRIEAPDPTKPLLIDPTNSSKIQFVGLRYYDPKPPGYDPTNLGKFISLRYEILRRPQKSSSTPLELPKGTVIDLTNSGFGLTGRTLNAASASICVLFAPGGAISRVMVDGNSGGPTQTMHLLVGSIEKLAEPGVFLKAPYPQTPVPPFTNTNAEDPANLWVSIGHQTGRVTTTENAWVEMVVPPGPPANANVANSIAASFTKAREFAQSSQAKGGR